MTMAISQNHYIRVQILIITIRPHTNIIILFYSYITILHYYMGYTKDISMVFIFMHALLLRKLRHNV